MVDCNAKTPLQSEEDIESQTRSQPRLIHDTTLPTPTPQHTNHSPLPCQLSFTLWLTKALVLIPSRITETLKQAWINRSDEVSYPFLWALPKSLTPLAGQETDPLFTQWQTPVFSPSSNHSASSRTTQGLRWLLAMLERKLTTSWDLAFSCRFWWGAAL